MRYFMDGHMRVYVDEDSECPRAHPKAEVLYHVMRRDTGRTILARVTRCPKSLSSQERSKLKEADK